MPEVNIDGRRLHFEVHGAGEDRPRMIAMGGWGTFCHGRLGDLPRAVVADFEVVVFDYRGLGESDDRPEAEASTRSYADDVAALLDHLGGGPVHVLGMVGMGACVGQELAIRRPDLVRSLFQTGSWAYADPALTDQLTMMRRVHQELGFEAFQMLCASLSFTPAFYGRHRHRLLGPDGAWGDLVGRADAHARLVAACLDHDTRDRLDQVRVPCFVLHAGRDPITTVDHTGLLADLLPDCHTETWADTSHVIAGKEQKLRLDALLRSFYDGLAAVPAPEAAVAAHRASEV
ncbi:alpha/beta fold hydrolase [Actinomycetospora chibensis]|uniref:Alpha/beta fold hydrolase n=1 Tax=Actinomycetospora chibensis TaxID=663606 RepID=A0ABV9RJB4_9PSEU|nr:alpha/beta hydrolase [Actinomycetospora chibensis]MDD7923836.1 alpha/beta hydrolase [Actinomycetospora chibensis]